MSYETAISYEATHRLVPAKYSRGTVLETLSLPENILSDLSQLDSATNERKQAERGGSLSIGPGELLLGVPEARVVNAAFCHPGPAGGRFHDRRRGAWYAGVELETSMAEASFHKSRFLEDAHFAKQATFEYQDFLADFAGQYSHLDDQELRSCLQPEPVPQCYQSSQALAISLLYSGSNGIVFPSVRKPGGTCIACFRPALVFHPRRGSRYGLTIQAGAVWNPAKSQLLGDS